MFTLLTTLVSFLTGGVPKLLDFFQNKSDNKHELEMAQLQFTQQLELQKAGFSLQKDLEEIKYDELQTTTAGTEREALYQHDIEIGKGASTWVINLRAMVRPSITFGLFGLLVCVELFGFYFAVHTGTTYQLAMSNLWSADMQTVWASIVAFWFGTQAFGKK
jgi:hypothetical protein